MLITLQPGPKSIDLLVMILKSVEMTSGLLVPCTLVSPSQRRSKGRTSYRRPDRVKDGRVSIEGSDTGPMQPVGDRRAYRYRTARWRRKRASGETSSDVNSPGSRSSAEAMTRNQMLRDGVIPTMKYKSLPTFP